MAQPDAGCSLASGRLRRPGCYAFGWFVCLRRTSALLVLATSLACSKEPQLGELGSGGIRAVVNLPQTNAIALDAAFDVNHEGLYLAALQRGVADYGFGAVGRVASEPPVVVLGRYTTGLNAVWTHELVAPFADSAAPKSAVDALGNLMVAFGDFTGELDLGNGPRTAPVLAQMSFADGSARWSITLPPTGNPRPRFVIVDPLENHSVVASAVDGPTLGTQVVRIDRFAPVNGTLLVTRPLAPSTGTIGLDSFTVDADGNLLVGGPFEGTITLTQVYNQTAGQNVGYIAKIGRDSGNALWSRPVRRRSAEDRVIVAPLAGGDVAVAGIFAFADDPADAENPLGPTLYLRVARLSGLSGETVWTTRYNLPNTAALDVVDLADYGEGPMFSATFSGTLQIDSLTAVSITASSMAMMHFAIEDGAPLWLRFSNITAATAHRVGIDATGDVAGVGTYISEDADRNPLDSVFVIRIVP